MTNFYQRKLSEGRAILAPMAGYTDAPFRKLCREFGSSWAVTEMVSAKGLVQGDLRGIEIGEPYEGEPDVVIQVFGGESEIVAEGGSILYHQYNPDALDLNMGCPVKKIVGKSCGSKLMQDPERAAEIIRQLVAAVPIPVSAKMRLGYDRVNVLEVALALQEAGVSLIAIHGRTAEQKYTGEAKWEAIKDVAERLTVPVIGSGDVTTKEQFDRYRSWGLGVMIARGAMGRPWIFAELQGKEKPTPKEIAEIAYRHAELHCDWYKTDNPQSELYAVRSLRSQLVHYFSFLPETRSELTQLSSLQELRLFIKKYLGMNVDRSMTEHSENFALV
jgi:tRNA-dihydrouridine synthase B